MVPRDRCALVTSTIEDKPESREADTDVESQEFLRKFQIESYAHLLHFPASQAGARNVSPRYPAISDPVIDAIIVPTIRPAAQLQSAVELAESSGCQLVPLYTDTFPAGLSSVFARLEPGQVTPLALRSEAVHELLDFGKARPQDHVSLCALDISRKRNLGLLIGRACGWRRMLFLDDDIRNITIRKLSSAAALMDKYPVVGFQVIDYPDASVVGHALRLTGARQKPFISGGSLLVNPQSEQGFFPPVYHEDWLCVINRVRLGEVAIGGRVGQLPYMPFISSNRAKLEEFGDIFATGLLSLVRRRKMMNSIPADARGNDSAAQQAYWHEAAQTHFWDAALKRRTALLDNIVRNFDRTRQRTSDIAALHSVKASRERLGELSPAMLVSFMENWLSDLAVWQGQLSSLPRAGSIVKALAGMSLSDAVRAYHTNRGQ